MKDTLAVQSRMKPLSLLVSLFKLTKPGVTVVLVFTAVATAWAASGPWLSALHLLWLALAGGLMASGAAAINQYLEQDIDSRMPRTSRRPLPAGNTSPFIALIWGILLCTSGLAISLLTLPLLSTFFIVLGLVIYIPVYTGLLKSRTTMNIVLGGAAGSCPVLAGWAAVRGDWTVVPIALAALIYFWTPAHFWAYALIHKKGYQQAGIPMLPSQIGFKATIPYIVIHILLMILASLFAFTGVALAIAFIGGIVMLGMGVWLWRDPRAAVAHRLYKYSNYYLLLVFFGMVIGR